MMEFNLLPEPYRRRMADARARRRSVAWAILLVAVGVGWALTLRLHVRQLQRRIDVERQKLEMEQRQADKLQGFLSIRRDVQAAQALLAELEEPVPLVGIMAALAHAVPEKVVLDRLLVDGPTVSVPNRKQIPGAVPKSIKIELGGLTHSDTEVVRCLSRLAQEPLFSNVKLVKTRRITEGGPPRVAFQISLDAPLGRAITIVRQDQEQHGSQSK